MALSDIITRWAGQMIAIEHVSTAGTYDGYGNPLMPSTAERYPAILQQKIQNVTGRDGSVKVSNTQITFHPSCPVTIDDRITLPDGSQPLIIAITRTPEIGSTAYAAIEVFT